MKPKISLVIPIYNQEMYLDDCLSSVASQSLQELEVLCVDDGSTDDTAAILERWAAQDCRIRVIRQENQGAAAARNAGIAQATGEYTIFLDADDRYPEAITLEKLYTAAHGHAADVCGGSFSLFTEDGTVRTEFEGPLLEGYTFTEEGFVDYREFQFDYGFHRFLFATGLLRAQGLLFPLYRHFEDPPFLARALYAAGRFYAIPDVVYAYRLGHQKLQWTEQRQLALLRGIEDLLAFSSEHGLEHLHSLAVRRLEDEYGGVFQLVLETPTVFAELVKLNTAVCPNLLEKDVRARYGGNCDADGGFYLVGPLRQQCERGQKRCQDILDLQKAVSDERSAKEDAWDIYRKAIGFPPLRVLVKLRKTLRR